MTYRMFARNVLDDTSPVVEFATVDELLERGGAGDELCYYPDTDTFTCDDHDQAMPNPVPGDPLAGAEVLIKRLEAEAC